MDNLKVKTKIKEDLEYGIINAGLDIALRQGDLLTTEDKETIDFLKKQIFELETGKGMLEKKLALLK